MLNEEEQNNNCEVSNFLKKNGLDNIIGLNLSLGRDWIWFGTSRKGEGNTYNSKELAVLQSLGPHIRKSLRLHLTMEKVQAQAQALGGLWSYKGKGVMILEEGGLVSFSNSYAEQLVASKLITMRRNQLSFRDTEVQKRFSGIMGYMLSNRDLDRPVQDSFLASDMIGREYGIRLFRHLDSLPALGITSLCNIMLVITPLDSSGKYSNGELERFGDLFHLTAAELRAVKMVSNMWEPVEFAASLGIRVDTIRHQLKAAMNKTGVHSQKELVRLVERFCFIQMR